MGKYKDKIKYIKSITVLKQLVFIADPQVIQCSVSNQRTNPRQVFITATPNRQQSPKTPTCPQKRQIVSNGHFDVEETQFWEISCGKYPLVHNSLIRTFSVKKISVNAVLSCQWFISSDSSGIASVHGSLKSNYLGCIYLILTYFRDLHISGDYALGVIRQLLLIIFWKWAIHVAMTAIKSEVPKMLYYYILFFIIYVCYKCMLLCSLIFCEFVW